jgi:hypothetical protein
MAKNIKKSKLGFLIIIPAVFGGSFLISSLGVGKVTYERNPTASTTSAINLIKEIIPTWPTNLDTKEYDKRLLALANYTLPKPIVEATTSTSSVATTTPILPVYSDKNNVTVPGKLWPAAAPYPNGDAIIPFKRILSYYGNFYSKNMGILGEYEPDEVLGRLEIAKAEWEAADPSTPVLKAIEYIAMVAQANAGKDGMYRAMMPDEEIEKAHALAKKADAILILDLQIGLSTIDKELLKFKDYITRPDVHIALDPQFSMKNGKKPGSVIGTFSAQDINYTINYISNIVK